MNSRSHGFAKGQGAKGQMNIELLAIKMNFLRHATLSLAIRFNELNYEHLLSRLEWLPAEMNLCRQGSNCCLCCH